MKLTLFSLFATMALMSCSHLIGPEHTVPDMEMPDRWSSGGASGKKPLSAAWWQVFDDTELNRLQHLALNANQDLVAAMHRIEESEATLRIQRADLLPIQSGSSSVQRSQQSANNNQIQVFTPEVVSQYRLGNTMSYELDLWGKVRRSVESKKASLQSVQYARDAVMLRLTGDVAQQYFALRTLDAEAAVLSDTIKVRNDSLQVTRTRFDGGLTTESDVTRAISALASAETDAADVSRRRDLIANTLAELSGQAASSFRVARVSQLPSRVPEPPMQAPATLLRQRPDIAEAERTLAARSAEIGVAMGERLPSIKLNANLSLESLTLSDLFSGGSRAFSFGPELDLPIFTGGANSARVKRAQAQHAQADAEWRSTVLTAIKEVEDALANQRGYRTLSDKQKTNAEAAAKTTALSSERYQKGLVNYLEVVDAQREELLARRSLVQAQGNRLAASVDLIKALGGGWIAKER